MKKIPTLFVREFNNHKITGIKPEFTNERCKHAFLYGLATVKWDGSCCAIIGGELYKRYDAKGKTIPTNAILCQEEPDPITGHFPCWVKCDVNNPADKWFFDAKNTRIEENGNCESLEDGTYEAIGKNFQGNPYNLTKNILVKHGVNTLVLLERDFDYVKDFLKNTNIEGLVFWLAGEPVCKIKRSDFGFEWNNTKRK
jgi:hypothetical protein